MYRCQMSPREFYDIDWEEQKWSIGRLWHRFAAYSDLRPPRAFPSRPGDTTSNTVPNTRTVAEETPPEAVRYLLDDDFHSAADRLDLTVPRNVFRSGCHKAFPDYYQRYQTQDRMEDAHLIRNMLPHILTQLPKVRTIHFTDYRCLIRGGEDYSLCCHRLFGNTLEPSHMGGISGPDEINVAFACWNAFLPVLEAMSASPTPGIEEFFLATNPYVYQNGTCVCDESAAGPRVSAPMPLDLFNDMNEISTRKLAHGFSNLRRLDLPSLLGDAGADDFEEPSEDGAGSVALWLRPLCHMLEAAAPTLTHLALAAHGLDLRLEDSPLPLDGAPIVFEILLSPVLLPSLQSLELVGFAFLREDLQKFLSRHQASLIELRLFINYVCGSSEELARWGGKHLALEGVRIANCDDIITPEVKEDMHPTSSVDTNHCNTDQQLLNEDLEALWLAGRLNRSAKIRKGFEHCKCL